MTKVVINRGYGGFGLSDEAVKLYSELVGDSRAPSCRHDPFLVRVVEQLGDRANDKYSELEIFEIFSDKYIITEYDGFESVVTPESINWVYV